MRLVTMDGREMPVSEALAEAGAGVSSDLFYRRMRLGWAQEEAMTSPPRTRKRTTETQRQASVASGKKLAERYRKYEFAPLCQCEDCAKARERVKPRTLAEKMKRAEREAAGRAKARLGIW